MREAAERLFRHETDHLKRILNHPLLFGDRACQFEVFDRGVEYVIDLVERVIRFKRVLENGLDLALERPPFTARQLCKVLAAVKHPAIGRHMTTQKQACERRLATPTLTGHSSDRWLIFIDSQRDVIAGNGHRTATKQA